MELAQTFISRRRESKLSLESSQVNAIYAYSLKKSV